MARFTVGPKRVVLITVLTTALTGQIPQHVRISIDRITGEGASIPGDKVYKVVLPRTEATIVYDYQTLSPNLGLNSWVAIKPGTHTEAFLTGELLLLDDEVDSVISTALDAHQCHPAAPHCRCLTVLICTHLTSARLERSRISQPDFESAWTRSSKCEGPEGGRTSWRRVRLWRAQSIPNRSMLFSP